jgi:hypothetical protein
MEREVYVVRGSFEEAARAASQMDGLGKYLNSRNDAICGGARFIGPTRRQVQGREAVTRS